MDGESVGDWYTGSGCVLMRNIIKYGFGVLADLDGVKIRAALHMPTNSAEMKVNLKGCDVTLSYKNTGAGQRKYLVNGAERAMTIDKISATPEIYLTNEELKGSLKIEIVD